MYIITVLVVTKSLSGYVSNQVQYNMESAQYLGKSYNNNNNNNNNNNKYILYIYIYIINGI